MRTEIELKFLPLQSLQYIVNTCDVISVTRIHQRYMQDTGKWTLRARRTKCAASGKIDHLFTMKKRISMMENAEPESSISEAFYNDIIEHCGFPIVKDRYCIKADDGHIWEVDNFLNPELNSLLVIELELTHLNETFVKPSWVGEDVTHDKQYKCARLAKLLVSHFNG